MSRRHEVSERIRTACAEVAESQRLLDEAQEQTAVIRHRVQDYWQRFGLSLESQTAAMNASTEVIEQLLAKLEGGSHEKAE